MRYLAALVLAAVAIGCREPHVETTHTKAESDAAVRESSPTSGGAQAAPPRMPGGVGVTAGQSGTGVTSGASTGY